MSAIDGRAAAAGQNIGGRWLDRDAILMAGIVAVAPNLLFILVSPWFLIRRLISPIIYLVAAFVAIFLPWPFAIVIFAVATIADALFIFAYIFSMPIGMTLEALRYAGDIDIAASLLYAGAIVYFIAIPIVLTCLVRRYQQRLRIASPVFTALIVTGIAFADYSVNGYKPLSPPAFESAMQQSGIDAEAILARDRNLLVVIVEGMGALADPAERAILSDRLKAVANGRFRMASGTSNYFGSTTGAEARELCGRWATFVEFLATPQKNCLPARLSAAGLRTVSYHAASAEMFSRRDWYPSIGIKEMNFREDIERDRPQAVHRRCGTVFVGLCDGDIAEIVRGDMIEAGAKRGLYYWLTLNSHLPYAPMPENRFGCATEHPLIKSVIPCQLTEIWADVFDSVARIAGDPKVPPLDILIVGDHNTPMWSRDAFRHFDQSKVDWYFLEDQRPALTSLARAGAP